MLSPTIKMTIVRVLWSCLLLLNLVGRYIIWDVKRSVAKLNIRKKINEVINFEDWKF